MKHLRCILFAGLLAGLRLSAAEAKPVAADSFEAFRLITDRNIFDPNRIARSRRAAEEAPPRSDILSVVGTMNYSKGLFAFFDGSAPAYRQVLREGQTIADYTVTHIDQQSVELSRNGQKLTLVIGAQLRRPPGGEWAVVAAETVLREAETQAASAAAAPAASPTSAPSSPASSDVLKRLMEQRQKQLKP